MGADRGQRTVECAESGGHQRLLGEIAGIGDEIARGEIIGAVGDDVVIADQLERVRRRQPDIVLRDRDMGIELVDRRRCGGGFRRADIGRAVDHLALQIRQRHDVVIDDAEGTDAGGRQIKQHRRAETAGADHEHARPTQCGLTRPADLAQDDVARVTLKFVGTQLGAQHGSNISRNGAWGDPDLGARQLASLHPSDRLAQSASSAAMNAKVASLAVGLLVAGVPAFAQQATKPTATKPAPSASHAETSHAKTSHANTSHANTSHATTSAAKHAASGPAALAAIPDADRLAIQADLAWLGHFEGLSAEEIGPRTLDAIRGFQRRNGGKETGVLSDQERALLVEAARPHQATVGWRLLDDSATGARIGVPEKLVPRASTARTGSRWSSPLGQVQIETFSLHDASLPALFEQEKKTSQRQVAYSALDPNSFVIIGGQHLKKFVVRTQSSGSEVRGVTILYDQATEGTMASVAVAIADTFVGFPDPNAGMATGHKRGVDYGSAIVVSNTGDLLGTADIADECQSITVPGFGHADRVAIDRANDLALLRLYGARNLVAAPLGGNPTSATDLTLFGAADPLAQAGSGLVSTATAELTAQGIAPAPSPGFSGAAALDGQGRFAGIVTLKSAIVAGVAPTGPQATLVPATAVRAFLAAQGIPTTGMALAADNATMDQSVMRLICVRK